MRVLVTGGAGFIGSNLCRELISRPEVDGVSVIDDLSTGDFSNLDGLNVDFTDGSILDVESLRTAAAGADAIVHLAARPSVPRSVADPMASHEANATGTLRVLEVARKSTSDPAVIVASSSSVYGANPVLPKSEDLRPVPMSPYAVSKLATESYALSHQSVYGMSTLAFRFFNVFGPLQAAGHAYAAVIPAFISAALAGQPIPLHGDGTQSRDFTFVGTVVKLLAVATIRRQTHSQPINLAFGTRTSLLEVIAVLEDILGRELEVERLPERAGDVPHSQADNKSLRSLFPDVEPTELRAGLEQTVDWFQSRP